MSLENAKANIKEFGKDLNLQLEFDENNTCILGIDNKFSVHLTYEQHSDRLYLYSPLLDGLPKDITLKLNLYEALLVGSMLGGQMAGGGVGVAVEEQLILMHAYLEMGLGSDASALRRFAPLFVEAVEKWRKKIEDILAGRQPEEDPRFTRPSGGALPGPSAPTNNQQKPGKPGQPFLKI